MHPDINKWTCDDVGGWLRSIGYEKYVKFFNDNQMDGQSLLALTTDDLYRLVKFFNEIFKLGDMVKFRDILVPLQRRKNPPEIGFGFGGNDTVSFGSLEPLENPILKGKLNGVEGNDVAPGGDAVTGACSKTDPLFRWRNLLPEGGSGFGSGDGTGANVADNWHTYNDSADVVIWGEKDDSCSTILDTPNSADETNLSSEILTPIKVEIPPAEESREATPTGPGASFSASVTPKIETRPSSPDGNTNITVTVPDQTSTVPEQESAPAAAVSAPTKKSSPVMDANGENKEAGFAVTVPPLDGRGSTPISTPTKNSAVSSPDSMTSPAVAAKSPPKMSAAASYKPDLSRRSSNASVESSVSAQSQAAASTQARVPSQALPTRRPLPSAHLSTSSFLYRYPGKTVALPDAGNTFRAYISYAESPLEFSILTEKSYDQVKKIGNILNNFYERDPYVLPLPPEMVMVGSACAAKFEGSWYRAIIEQLLTDAQVLVRYVDYGNKETLPQRALMALKRDKMTDVPPQSIDLRLAGIPDQFPISSAQRDDFFDMAEPLQKTFLVKIDCGAQQMPYTASVIDAVSNQSLNMQVQRLLGIPVANYEAEPLKENMNPNGDANELDDAFWNDAVVVVSSDEDDDF